MSNVYLKIPTIDELHYRQMWMMDPKTMEYNAGYDLNIKGYNRENGTIIKNNDEMIEWYSKWFNKEPDKYFAYIYDYEIDEPVGEVYYYLDGDIHSMGIVIQDKYRGKGYSYKSLLKLEKIAFEKNKISELSDVVPLDRIGAIKSFKKAGFIHTNLEQEEIVFGDKKISKQLLITKEMYDNRLVVEVGIKLDKEITYYHEMLLKNGFINDFNCITHDIYYTDKKLDGLTENQMKKNCIRFRNIIDEEKIEQLESNGYKKVFDTTKEDHHYSRKDIESKIQLQEIEGIGLIVYYDNPEYYGMPENEQWNKLIKELNTYGFNFESNIEGIDKLRTLYYGKEMFSKNQNG